MACLSLRLWILLLFILPASSLLANAVNPTDLTQREEFVFNAGATMGAPITIATALTLSDNSAYSKMGRILERAYLLFLEWVNSIHGGINIAGTYHPVSLRMLDDQSNDSLVEEIATGFLDQEVKLFLGPCGSLTEAQANVVNRTDTLMIAPLSADPSVFQDRPRVFGMLPQASDWYRATVQALAEIGVTSIMAISDSVFQDMCSSLSAIAQENGVRFVETVLINGSTSTDLTQAISRVAQVQKETKPSALLGCTQESTCEIILKALAAGQVNFKSLVFTECVTSSSVMSTLGNDGLYVLGLTPWLPTLPVRSNVTGWKPSDFDIIYRHRYPSEVTTPYEAASAFAAGVTLVHAIEEAASLDTELIRTALDSADVNTLFGRIKFNALGMNNMAVKAVQQYAIGSKPALVFGGEGGVKDRKVSYPLPTWAQRSCFLQDAAMRTGNRGLQLNNSWDNTTAPCSKCLDGQATKWVHNSYYGTMAWKCHDRSCTLGQTWGKSASDGLLNPNAVETCHNCAPGKYGTSDLLCISCESGFFSNTSSATACVACSSGYYQSATGATACQVCEQGYEADTPAQSSCAACVSGHATNHSTAPGRCELCPKGMIAADRGSLNCSACPAGRYSAWGARQCVDCPIGTYQSEPSQDFCNKCPTGTLCTEEGVSVPPNLQEWWAYLDDAHPTSRWQYSPCLHPGHCLLDKLCAKGQTGPLCSVCLPGHSFSLFDFSCRECPNKTLNLAVTLVFASIVCGVCMVMADLAIQGSFQTKSMISPLLKLLVNYVTTMAFMALVLMKEVQRKSYESMISGRNDAQSKANKNLDIEIVSYLNTYLLEIQTSFFSLECLIEPYLSAADAAKIQVLSGLRQWEYLLPEYSEARNALSAFHRSQEEYRVLLWGCLPVLLIALLFMFGYVSISLNIRKNKELYVDAADFFVDVKEKGWLEATKTRTVKDYHAYMKLYNYRLFGIWRMITLAAKHGRSFRLEFRQAGEPLMILITFFTFPYVMKAFLRPLSCVEAIDSDRYGARIEAALDVECYGNNKLFWGSLGLLVIMGLGVPAVCAFLLWEHRDKLNRDRFKRSYGFLVTGYEVDRRWWECFMLTRKTLGQTIACVGLTSRFRIWTMLCCSCFFFIQHVFYEPFDNRYEELLDKMEFRHLVCWVGWSIIILGYHMLDHDAPRWTTLGIFGTLGAIHVSFFLMLVKHILLHALNERAERLLHTAWHDQSKDHLSATEDVDHFAMKHLPHEVYASQTSCTRKFPLKVYTKYQDTLAYFVFNTKRTWTQLLGNKGGKCEVPPDFIKGYKSLRDVVTPPKGVDLVSEHERGFLMEIVGEALEYTLVNCEISGFSASILELIIRSGFALGSDGHRRTITVSHGKNHHHSSAPSGAAASLAENLLGQAGRWVSLAVAPTEPGESQRKLDRDDEDLKNIGVGIERDMGTHKQEYLQMDSSKTSYRSSRDQKVDGYEEVKHWKYLEAKADVREQIRWLFDPHIFLRGLTFQEFHLNLAASLMVREKRQLLLLFNLFENHQWHVVQRSASISSHDEIQDDGDDPWQFEADDCKYRPNVLHAQVQARHDKIDVALGAMPWLPNHREKKRAAQHQVNKIVDHSMHATDGKTARMGGVFFMQLGAGTEDVNLEIDEDDADIDEADLCEAEIHEHRADANWSRLHRRLLCEYNKRCAQGPFTYQIQKLERKKGSRSRRMQLLQFELSQLQEDLALTKSTRAGGAPDTSVLVKAAEAARKEHAELCRESLRLHEALRDKTKDEAKVVPILGMGKLGSNTESQDTPREKQPPGPLTAPPNSARSANSYATVDSSITNSSAGLVKNMSNEPRLVHKKASGTHTPGATFRNEMPSI